MTQRRASRPRPVVKPAPGVRLRREINQALLDLREVSAPDDPTMRLLNDRLHGVLAHTAAIGETCQVAPAVDAVREAQRHLAAGQPDQAGSELVKALKFLSDLPHQASAPGTARQALTN